MQPAQLFPCVSGLVIVGTRVSGGGTPEGLSWEEESCGTIERFPPDLRFPS